MIHFVSAGNSLRDTLCRMDEWKAEWIEERRQSERKEKKKRWMSSEREGGREGKLNGGGRKGGEGPERRGRSGVKREGG